MIVTIDGPAGAGKSSIAREVADRLGFEFLDTGAMYRAITLGAIRNQIELDDTDALVAYAGGANLRWENCRIFLDDEDVSDEIRVPTVTAAIRHLADLPAVRHQLSLHQRQIAERSISQGRNIVTEGRDQGSEVFPEAQCKIFLTASSHQRALRRQQQLSEIGRFLPLEEVLQTQQRRDAEDYCRPVGALRAAEDAIEVDTDDMTPEQVLDRVLGIVNNALQASQNR